MIAFCLPRASHVLLALVVTTALAASACSSSGGDTESSSGASSGSTPNACADDTRKDIYAAGLSKQATTLSVKILDSNPAPPAKLTNAMTLQVLDAGGAPVDGAIVSVVPFMPDHGHGSAVKPTVTARGGGAYEVTKLYYPMPGLWRVTVTVQLPNASAQDVAFSFCIDG